MVFIITGFRFFSFSSSLFSEFVSMVSPFWGTLTFSVEENSLRFYKNTYGFGSTLQSDLVFRMTSFNPQLTIHLNPSHLLTAPWHEVFRLFVSHHNLMDLLSSHQERHTMFIFLSCHVSLSFIRQVFCFLYRSPFWDE